VCVILRGAWRVVCNGSFEMCDSVWERMWCFYGIVLCNCIVTSVDYFLTGIGV